MMVEDPLLVGSATLVAVMVTVLPAVMDEGAVYSPLEDTVPRRGDKDHVTPVLLDPVTCAVNCAVCEAVTDAVGGVICTATCGAALAVISMASIFGLLTSGVN